jgi:AcrR family transcriptional regulator
MVSHLEQQQGTGSVTIDAMRVTVQEEAHRPVPRGRGGRPRIPGLTDRILEATIELAAEAGVDDLTLDAIAARAEVGRPTIYRRWASKEALLSEALDKMVETYFRPPKAGNIRDELVEFAQRMMDLVDGPLRSVWLAYFNMERAHVASTAVERAASPPQDIVRRGIERGEIRPDADPQTLMELIFAPIWYRTSIKRPFDPSFAERIVDGVLNSWLPPKMEG